MPAEASGIELVFDLEPSERGIEGTTIPLESAADSVCELEQELAVDVYGVEDVLELGDVETSVTGVVTDSRLSQFTETRRGCEFAVVTVSITGKTGDAKRFSQMIHTVAKDGNGYTYRKEIGASVDLDQGFDEGTPLLDDETRRGELV